MAYGGPASLDEIPGYLADIRAGRPTPHGGPRRDHGELPRDRRALAAARRDATAGRRAGRRARRRLPVLPRDAPLVALDRGGRRRDGGRRRHARRRPRARAALQRAVGRALPAEGRRRARRSTAAGSSSSTCGATTTHPGLVDAFAGRVEEGLSRWPEAERGARARRLQRAQPPGAGPRGGRPLRRAVPRDGAARRGARGAPAERWSWSYQSAGRTPEPWAGPDLGEHLEELAARGVRDVVCVPVGFVSDHVELLYDVDVRARAVADAARAAPRAPPGAERRPGLHRRARRRRPTRARVTGSEGTVHVGVMRASSSSGEGSRASPPRGGWRRSSRDCRARAGRAGDELGGKILYGARRRLRDRGRGGQLPLAEGARRRALRGARARRRARRPATRERADVRPPRRRAPPAAGGAHGADADRSRRAGRVPRSSPPRAEARLAAEADVPPAPAGGDESIAILRSAPARTRRRTRRSSSR